LHNPAVTLARAFTDTFAGIRPADTPVKLLCSCPKMEKRSRRRDYVCCTRSRTAPLPHPILSGRDALALITARNAGYAERKLGEAEFVFWGVTLRIIWHRNLRAIWHNFRDATMR
jgi:hypothetical protein